MTRIVHLTSVHPPFDSRIFTKECCSLAQAGYEVVLVATHEKDEVRDGIRIHSIPKPRNRRERMVVTTFQVLRAALRERGALYHFHDPELIPVGVALKILGMRVIYDVHEDLPRQIREKLWIPSILRRLMGRTIAILEWSVARIFDAIVTVTPHIASRFPEHKTEIVRNYPILGELAIPKPTPFKDRPPLVAYVGGIAEIRGIREMVQAMGKLPEHPDACLMLAGMFDSQALEDEVKTLPGWERVDYRGWQNRDQVAKMFDQARVGLVVLHPVINYLTAYPVKLFEYMAASLPVIASDFPVYREMVAGANCGLLVDPMDPDAISEALRWLLEHPAEAQAMGERGREAVLRQYNWNAEKEILLDLYRRLLKEASPPKP